ncbi:MAG: ECF transporter S component [Clostridia bacterium]|nr:ECF transporter S component [Clostridia bacterium]MBR3144755.1 ECF transporter S component [Clostridia bacterium]
METKINLKKISVAAVLSALAYASVFVLRFKVQFLTLDFKDAIIAITSLLLGPLYGVCSAAVVALLEFLSVSDTGLYGLIMNFLSSGTFALTCGIIYKYKRTFKGAVLSVVMSVISVTAVMLLANLFITPLFMGAPREVVIAMLPKLLLPFNLIKASMNAAITLVIYKPLSSGLKRANLLPRDNKKYRFDLRSAIITVCAVIVIVIAVLVLVLYLGGNLEIFRS